MAASPNKPNLRRLMRIKATPRGELIDGSTSIKVLMQDISDEGFQVLCSREFDVGEIYELKFPISPGAFVECTVEVRHSGELGTGLKILTMNEQNRRLFDRYLQEHFSHNLGKFG